MMKKVLTICYMFLLVASFSYAEDGKNIPELLLSIDAHMIKSYPGSYLTPDGVKAVAFSPDEKFLVSGGIDGYIKFWNPKTGKLIRSFNENDYDVPNPYHPEGVCSLAFSLDGVLLASGMSRSNVMLWDISNGKLIRFLPAVSQEVNAVAFSPDGKVLVYNSLRVPFPLTMILYFTGFKYAGVKFVNIGEKKQIINFLGHSDAVYSLAFSPDGKIFATGLHNNRINIWDWRKRKLIKTIHGHERISNYINGVYVMAFSPDGSILVSSGTDWMVKLWDTKTWQKIRFLPAERYKERSVGMITSLAFSPDGRLLACGTAKTGEIYIWDIKSGEVITCFQAHEGNRVITSIAFSPDGTLIASGSDDGTVKIWKNSFLKD